MSIVSCFLMADWQSIPQDSCVALSPFHHPDLIFNVSGTQDNLKPIYKMAEDRHMDSHKLMFTTDNLKIMNCSFSYYGHSNHTIDCFIVQNSSTSDMYHNTYSCILLSNRMQYRCSKKLHLYGNTSDEIVNIQSLHLLSSSIYNRMMTQCEEAKFEGEHCHWIPKSMITNRYCHDCQPICRSPKHSLNFAQFCIGAAILMLSIPVAWIPIASLVSDRVNGELQV